MNKFDETFKEIFEGLASMGTTGLAKQGGKGSEVNAVNYAKNSNGQGQVNGSVQKQFAPTNPATANAANQQQQVPPQQGGVQQNVQQDQNELQEFTQLGELQKTNVNEFNKNIQNLATQDPNKFNRYISSLLNPQV